MGLVYQASCYSVATNSIKYVMLIPEMTGKPMAIQVVDSVWSVWNCVWLTTY